jgi:MFS family permease
MKLLKLIYFIKGSTAAGMIFPYLADIFGRKRTLVFSVLVGGGAIFLCGFMVDLEALMLLIFISGFSLNGYETISLVYVTEISG